MPKKIFSILVFVIFILSSAACAAQPAAPAATTVPVATAVPAAETPSEAVPTVAAPAPEASSAGAFTVTDALGREVKFDKAPTKIVLAGKALFMVAEKHHCIGFHCSR
ncbi:MAG: hypothetical protein LWX83_17645 [Anaerolineae bacterium]|nr:hypothetical protein [Anaerolineae bacterium]